MLKIKNAFIHNLKNFSVNIPHNSFVCVTGVSGSGKSSLVYNIIEKEANKRFFESFSVYARQFLKKTSSVDAEISGIRPVISIRQKTIGNDLRSTAGTLSGFSDLLRLLMARFGKTKRDDLKLSRGLFSFNNPLGQCNYCKGIGEEEFIDEALLVADGNKTLREGALKITLKDGYTIYSQVTIDVLNKVCNSEGFNVDIPFKNLDQRMKNILFYGSDKIKIPFGKHTLASRMKWKGIVAKPREEGYYKGIIPIMTEILKRDRNPNILKFCSSKTCSHCSGSGLKPEVLEVLFEGQNFFELSRKTFSDLYDFFSNIKSESNILNEIISAILKKCRVLQDLGLDYLTPSRKSGLLSGGESQRIRISAVLDNDISGIMYIFDEPSIGLHETDNLKLIKILKTIVNKGNTVIVVEHNKETIMASDYLVDIGPMAGYKGGKLLYSGNFIEFNIKDSITYQLLSSQNINKKKSKKEGKREFLYFEGVKYNNLKDINVKFEINSLNVVTGVSGAGKSSLVNGIVLDYFENNRKCNFKRVSDYKFDKIVSIDAKQPGKNSRSNAVTYTGIFDYIRKLFASLSDSFSASSFSFNSGNGRCAECLGKGETEITMHFLENIKVVCTKCGGKRFNDDILEIKYKGKNISEVLDLEISEALEFFKNEPKILEKLDVLNKLGLGYLKLGQPTSTFSGGEAKRLKLSAYLDSKSKNNLIILDEPTNGLSIYDTKILLDNLLEITKTGNTIIAIEHDSFFISSSDFIVDLGPKAGDLGGEVLYEGDFEGLLKCKKSLTAQIFNPKENIFSQKIKIKNEIILGNVSTNNLKSINCKIQKNAVTLVKGGEGAGKTSLIIDTIFNEANNLYLSSLSAYSRQFIGNYSKGKFDFIKNLSAAISLRPEKKRADRITFGQVSGLYDLYRLLYSRFAKTSVSLPVHQRNNSLFSFMHISGACSECSGRGFIDEIDKNKLANFELSIENGALEKTKVGRFFSDLNGQYMATLYAVMDELRIEKFKKLKDYNENEINVIFNGTKGIKYKVEWKFKRSNRSGIMNFESVWKGFLNLVKEDYLKNIHNKKLINYKPLLRNKLCPVCSGRRLNKIALSYKIGGLTISDLSAMDISNQIKFFNEIKIDNSQILLDKIIDKLNRLQIFNLSYISSDRSYNSLSSGEKQRLRLSMLAKENLRDVLYILDEPANGLYYKEEDLIKKALTELKNQGNTVILSDAKERFIDVVDNIIELENGTIQYAGCAKLYKNKSLFKKYQFPAGKIFFEIKGAYLNNLKNIDVKLAYNTLNIVHGPCGSGKSSLVLGVLANSLNEIYGCKSITANFSNVIVANDNYSSITIASYFEINKIIFEKLAKRNNVKKNIFTSSKNLCNFCHGKGSIKGNLDFLGEKIDICPVCNGKKYNEEVLSYKLFNYTIHDLFRLPLCKNNSEKQDSIEDIIDNKKIVDLAYYFDVFGVGNLSIDRKFSSLSIWERKRFVIIKKILKNPHDNLILIDEAAAGLDIDDMNLLIKIFRKLLVKNTIVITEHDKDLISCAGNSIELGYGSGEEGGRVIND